MDYCVITFSNTHGAISCKKYLKADFPITIMPAPREISKGCGIAVRFDADLLPDILKKLAAFPLDKKMYSIHICIDGCCRLFSE